MSDDIAVDYWRIVLNNLERNLHKPAMRKKAAHTLKLLREDAAAAERFSDRLDKIELKLKLLDR